MRGISVLLPAFVLVAATASAKASLTIAVIDTDTKIGIEADVILIVIGPPKVEKNIATTDQSGMATNGSVVCQPGDVVYVNPHDGVYPSASPKACNGDHIEIRLRSLAQARQIQSIAKQYEVSGQAGRATQALSELNWTQPNSETQVRIMRSAARALGVTPSQATKFDPDQGKVVASAALVKKVRQFQTSKGLIADGILGTKTLAALADGSVQDNVFGQVPPM